MSVISQDKTSGFMFWNEIFLQLDCTQTYHWKRGPSQATLIIRFESQGLGCSSSASKWEKMTSKEFEYQSVLNDECIISYEMTATFVLLKDVILVAWYCENFT